MSDFWTVRRLREKYSLPPNVISYAIDRYGPEHAGRVGITRYWAPDDLPAIREALRKTGALESAHLDCEQEQEVVLA